MLRVRFVPEDLLLSEAFDPEVTDLVELAHQIDIGELDHLCALVEKRCCECATWILVDSLGSICAPPGDPYWGEVKAQLLEENKEA